MQSDVQPSRALKAQLDGALTEVDRLNQRRLQLLQQIEQLNARLEEADSNEQVGWTSEQQGALDDGRQQGCDTDLGLAGCLLAFPSRGRSPQLSRCRAAGAGHACHRQANRLASSLHTRLTALPRASNPADHAC